MTSRERVHLALNHQESDRVPVDLGAGPVTGMQVDTVYNLRQALGLDAPGTPVKVVEPYQMLGEIKADLMAALGIDVVGLSKASTMFGFKNEGWKHWTTFAGTPVLVPEGFNTDPDENGDILMYPEGDKSVPPSGRMPKGGFYFDSIPRQLPLDDNNLKLEDNVEEFTPISDADLAYLGREAERLWNETDKAVLANFGGTAFRRHCAGARPLAEASQRYSRCRRVVRQHHDAPRLCVQDFRVPVRNRHQESREDSQRRGRTRLGGDAVGNGLRPTAWPVHFAQDLSRASIQPFNKAVNDWVHKNTTWKTFIHSCGSVRALLPEFIAAGFDVLNPVQCSAACMAPEELKQEFGDRVTFWGGGVDTQKTLPFGTVEDVRNEVRSRVKIFGKGGGFVFNSIHNVQAGVPIENVLAMYETVREFGSYQLAKAS